MLDTEIDGRYRVQEALGEGGTGTVYRAVHAALGREVAIKILHPQFGASPELRARFEREARALSVLSHPNVVGVIDSGVSGDQPYLVMELLRGRSLESRLKDGPLPISEATFVMRELLAALAFVHQRGLVHRDVKPANVFLSDSQEGARVRLLDFGLAKFIAPEAGDESLTRAGQVFGTPLYMAPEQVAGQEADARADVYSAGLVFFEMLTGTPPFRGDASDVLRKQVAEDVPLQELPPDVPPSVVRVIEKATAKSRKDRYADGAELLGALDAAVVLGSSAPEAPVAPAGGSVLAGLSIRLAYVIVSLVSLGAILAMGLAIYVFVTPTRAREKSLIEAFLGPAASAEPEDGAAPPSSGAAASLPAPPVSAAVALSAPSGSAPPGGSSVPEPAAPPSSAPAPPAPPAPRSDPWVGAPPELLKFASKVNHGRFFDKRDVTLLHQYNARHAADPRGHLLLARSHLKRRWLKDSAAEYAAAYQTDPNAAGDPRMLADLLLLVELGAPEAGKLAVQVYGSDVRAGLERELSKKTLRADHRARLERFRREISASLPAGSAG